MAQDYDKIFREVLRDIFPAVAQRVLDIPAGQYQPLPAASWNWHNVPCNWFV
jgi:hypothetical protein